MTDSGTCVLGAIFGLEFPETVPISWSGTVHRSVVNSWVSNDVSNMFLTANDPGEPGSCLRLLQGGYSLNLITLFG